MHIGNSTTLFFVILIAGQFVGNAMIAQHAVGFDTSPAFGDTTGFRVKRECIFGENVSCPLPCPRQISMNGDGGATTKGCCC